MRQQLLFAVLRQPLRVLDHVAIHVGDPQRTIWAGADHDGAAPAVFAGEQVHLQLGGIAHGFEGDAFVFEEVMLHDVVEGLAGEGVCFAVVEEHLIAIHLDAAGAGEASGLIKAVEALFHAAGGIHGRIAREELMDRVRRDDVRIAAQVVILQDVVPERKTVLHAEPVAPVIAGATELRGAGLRIKLARVRLEAEIAAAEVDLLAGELALDLRALVVAAVMRARGAIHPAVHAPTQAVHAELLIAGLLLAVLALGAQGRTTLAMSVGFLWGLALDAYGVSAFGVQGWLLALAGYLSGSVSKNLNAEKWGTQETLTLVATAGLWVGIRLLSGFFDHSLIGRPGVGLALAHMGLNALVAPGVFWGMALWGNLWGLRSGNSNA